MRFFIALEIPEQSKAELAKVQARLKEIIPDIKLTDNDKLHLTIAFIGEQPDEQKQPLIDIISTASSGISTFQVTPSYVDGFPSLHNAHILWMGVKGDIDKLFILRERVKDGLKTLNLNTDERRFVPHIALGKIKNFILTPAQEHELEKLDMQNFASITVSSIKLFESTPQDSFHIHNTLAEIRLQ